MRIPNRKPIDELLKMSKQELHRYLRESEVSMRESDSVKIIHFEHGTKIIYYHKDEDKPYKTRVYLNKVDESDFLK